MSNKVGGRTTFYIPQSAAFCTIFKYYIILTMWFMEKTEGIKIWLIKSIAQV